LELVKHHASSQTEEGNIYHDGVYKPREAPGKIDAPEYLFVKSTF
jgi:hypothetical protein